MALDGEKISDKKKSAMTLADAVSKCVALHKGSVHDAAEALLSMVRQSPALREQLVEHLLEAACRTKIGEAMRSANSAIWHSAAAHAEQQKVRPGVDRNAGPALAGYARRHATRLMEYALAGGLLLKDATKADLLANAEAQETQGKRMLQTGRWLRLIANKMGDTQTVGKALKEKELAKLQEEALAA